MLDKEFVSKVEDEIRFEEEWRDDEIDSVERDYIIDVISESRRDLELKRIWRRFNDTMRIFCVGCISRDASNEELVHLFGEDYKQYL